MKKILSAFLLWIGSAALLLAQAGSISVEVVLEQDQFLPNEDFRVAVKVTNFSGQQLQLGKENDWLKFSIESRDIPIVEKYSDVPMAGEFALESSMTATRRANLNSYFNLEKPGRYQITVRAKISQWNQEVVSPPKAFDVVRGAKLKEVEFGLPQQGNAPPETRKYVLQQVDFLKEMKLYLRITDASGARTYKVFPIARMISFSRPEAQLDRFSNLHVLHQVGQRSFNYCVVNPEGQIITRQTHNFQADSRPRLAMTEDGRINVRGGLRRISDADLPPADNSSATQNTNGEQPKL